MSYTNIKIWEYNQKQSKNLGGCWNLLLKIIYFWAEDSQKTMFLNVCEDGVKAILRIADSNQKRTQEVLTKYFATFS